MNHRDPQFEIVDDPNGVFAALVATTPTERNQQPPDFGDDSDEDIEVLREN